MPIIATKFSFLEFLILNIFFIAETPKALLCPKRRVYLTITGRKQSNGATDIHSNASYGLTECNSLLLLRKP